LCLARHDIACSHRHDVSFAEVFRFSSLDIEQLGDDVLVIAASILTALDFQNRGCAETTMSHIDRQKIPNNGYYAMVKPIQPWHLTNPRSGLQRIFNTLECAIILLGVDEPRASMNPRRLENVTSPITSKRSVVAAWL
jgi:hypothetical protein